ncbi:MAG: SPFH domain-containing protein [Alphaproteobacteria bacterium]|nr:SPFH domain-containing protein [Alphaproteobacteria bacterium]MCB9794503.1 SPFH domain-containing protein [Alphaproteobacteria bacterium]
MFFTLITAPHKGLLFIGGKPSKVLEPGFHIVPPFISRIRRVNCALHTAEVEVDVITRGGTPTQIKVGYTARITDVEQALVNMDNPFATLRSSVISVVSGTANNYTIDQLAQRKSEISEAAEDELHGLSKKNGWGLGGFQITVGDPSMSEELKKLLMREEAVRRENAANLERAKNQLEVAQQLLEVSRALDAAPFARELLRMQMLTDMGEGGKVIVVDSRMSDSPSAQVVVKEVFPQLAESRVPAPARSVRPEDG